MGVDLTKLLCIAAIFLTSQSWPIPALRANQDGPETYAVGAAAVDITPSYPIRLSGFAFRRAESESVRQRLWAKALAIGTDREGPALLLTVEACIVPGHLVNQLARRLYKNAGIKSERLAVTYTHTHTAPMLKNSLPTLFGVPIPPEHQARIDGYTEELLTKLEKVCLAALADRKPARLTWGVGSVGFAINRRTKSGPVDHDLPVLVVSDSQGHIRAIYVTYACHCVTLQDNKISGDWAGYAADQIQNSHPGAIALVSIGCGADSNPEVPEPRRQPDLATEQGAELAAEVNRLIKNFLAPVMGKLDASIQTIELPLQPLPTRPEWEKRAKRKDAIGYHARIQLESLNRGEQLKTKIDYNLQSWRFGESLAMVFMPGEVVVDYSLRLKRELDRRRLWLTAYANDAPGYIPSERVLKEGGYEGAGAMIYYGVPAPFQRGLEEKITNAIKNQVASNFPATFDAKRVGGTVPLSPQQSLAAIQTKRNLIVQLMAAEPLVMSPVAIDFGPDGRLWVVEMLDYPNGEKGNFQPGGRIRLLESTRGDGIYDRASVFLDKIPFPTGVTVWRKGILVCAAPDILYAEDTRGEGKADLVKKLFTGFGTDNYQARVNSLHYGLDGWVYGSCGLFGGAIRSHVTGKTLQLGDRDFRCNPDTGALESAVGRTQQGRPRDDWDNWFGCDNSNLCWHYPLKDQYLQRNPYVAQPNAAVAVPADPDPNRLFPARGHVQLFKLSGPPNRTTSACGIGIYRDDFLGMEYTGNTFTCEPVNLLVHRLVLSPAGSSFAGRRARDEQQSEFLASTDGWSRPVQARTGPDGAIWVVDMYRHVIEHPRWIPPEDLARLDVRAGYAMGRIYRVYPKDRTPRPIARLDRMDTAGLVDALQTANGWQRDMASEMLRWRRDKSAAPALEQLVKANPRPETRLHALCLLDGLELLQPELICHALADSHPGVRRHALRIAERHIQNAPELGPAMAKLVNDPDAQVLLQLACSLGEWQEAPAGRLLAKLLLQSARDPYLTTAVLSSLTKANAGDVVGAVLAASGTGGPPPRLVEQLMEAAAVSGKAGLAKMLRRMSTAGKDGYASWQIAGLSGILGSLQRRGQTLANTADPVVQSQVEEMLEKMRALAANDKAAEQARIAAIQLLGRSAGQRKGDLEILGKLLVPQNSTVLQSAAVTALGRFSDLEVSRILVKGWRGFTPVLQVQVLDLLLSRETWQRQLLDGIEKNEIPVGHLDAARRERFFTHRDAGIRLRAARLFAGATNVDRQKVIGSYEAALSLQGDRLRGKAVFARTCSACHRLKEVGHAVGPDLTAVSAKTPQFLLTEILDPNKNVDSRYVNYLALTKGGRSFTGIMSSETATSITLTAQEGKQQVLLRTELDELQSTGKSLMPEGLEKDLSRQEVADLLSYLKSGPTGQ